MAFKEELKEFSELIRDEESRQELIDILNELREDIYPVLELFSETIGEDLDKLVDVIINWGAKKSMVAYEAYILAGFSPEKAFALTCNLQSSLGRLPSLINAKT